MKRGELETVRSRMAAARQSSYDSEKYVLREGSHEAKEKSNNKLKVDIKAKDERRGSRQVKVDETPKGIKAKTAAHVALAVSPMPSPRGEPSPRGGKETPKGKVAKTDSRKKQLAKEQAEAMAEHQKDLERQLKEMQALHGAHADSVELGGGKNKLEQSNYSNAESKNEDYEAIISEKKVTINSKPENPEDQVKLLEAEIAKTRQSLHQAQLEIAAEDEADSAPASSTEESKPATPAQGTAAGNETSN